MTHTDNVHEFWEGKGKRLKAKRRQKSVTHGKLTEFVVCEECVWVSCWRTFLVNLPRAEKFMKALPDSLEFRLFRRLRKQSEYKVNGHVHFFILFFTIFMFCLLFRCWYECSVVYTYEAREWDETRNQTKPPLAATREVTFVLMKMKVEIIKFV